MWLIKLSSSAFSFPASRKSRLEWACAPCICLSDRTVSYLDRKWELFSAITRNGGCLHISSRARGGGPVVSWGVPERREGGGATTKVFSVSTFCREVRISSTSVPQVSTPCPGGRPQGTYRWSGWWHGTPCPEAELRHRSVCMFLLSLFLSRSRAGIMRQVRYGWYKRRRYLMALVPDCPRWAWIRPAPLHAAFSSVPSRARSEKGQSWNGEGRRYIGMASSHLLPHR